MAVNTSILLELGLSPNEAKIYEALLIYGGSGVSSASLRSKVHRRNAYDALQRLLNKGLVSEVYGKLETIYEPVDPNKLRELLEEKQRKLDTLMPELQQEFHHIRPAESSYIFKGIEGVKNYLNEALNIGQNIYRLGAEGVWLDPRLADYTQWFLEKRKKKHMKIHAIFDHDIAKVEGHQALADDYKIMSHKYDSNATMDVFGDVVVTFTGTAAGKLMEDSTIFVMHSPDLAESYRQWWKQMWDLLPKEKKTRTKKRK